MTDPDRIVTYCGLCGHQSTTAQGLWQHLDEHHPETARDVRDNLLRWPDGDPVIIDHTINPDDFTADGPQ